MVWIIYLYFMCWFESVQNFTDNTEKRMLLYTHIIDLSLYYFLYLILCLMNRVVDNSFHRFNNSKFSYNLRWKYSFGVLATILFPPILKPTIEIRYPFFARVSNYIQTARIKWMRLEISILSLNVFKCVSVCVLICAKR